jgi:hypothetical protein
MIVRLIIGAAILSLGVFGIVVWALNHSALGP